MFTVLSARLLGTEDQLVVCVYQSLVILFMLLKLNEVTTSFLHR